MSNYSVENQWGGNDAPWHPGGTWFLGTRDAQNQKVLDIQISSEDGGYSFFGTITYEGEGPIGFRATKTEGNSYETQNQWGGEIAPWHEGGIWVIGGRDDQSVVELHVSSSDGGFTLEGTNTYVGEGPIGFRGTIQQ